MKKKQLFSILYSVLFSSIVHGQTNSYPQTGPMTLAYPGSDGYQLITMNQNGVYGVQFSVFNGESLIVLRDSTDWNPKIQLRSGEASFINGGNLGIGTSTPKTKLDIRGQSATSSATLQIVGTMTSTLLLGQDAEGGVIRGQGGSNALKFLVGGSGDQAASESGIEGMRIMSTGNVGIGTTSPGIYKLAVNGIVRAKEVIVDTGWSDFVFKDSYNLRSLDEVENHIEEHGHLPDVPSAATVESEGLSIGEAQKIMMQKIEELTLYMIEKDKQIAALQTEVQKLKSK